MPSASRQPLAAGGRTRAPRPCWLMRVGVHGMSTPADSLTDPLAYAPKWARHAAIAEPRNAAWQDHVSEHNASPDDAWPTEWPPAARSVDPIDLPPPPSRSPLRVWFAIAGAMAISAAAGAIAALFMVGKLPSWGLFPEDVSRGAISFETRFIGQNDQTDGASWAKAAANEQARLAVPLRQTDGASLSAAANEQPPLAEPLRQTDGATSPSAAANEQPPLAEPPRQTDGATSPSAAANEQPPLAEPPRQTDGATSPSAAANEQPPLSRGATVEHVTESVSPTPSALNSDAIAAFLERAQELLASGDIAAARLLLLRAAEARDPKAALALAATFDPIILQRIGAYGVVPEVPSARHWYEKAKEFGSEEASQRLEMLVRRQM
jgi:TPR repeat protein